MANRIGRLELLFWWAASIVGASMVAAIVGGLTNTTFGYYPHKLPEALILIAATLVMLRAVLSRLHDIGWPGWALVLLFVPLVDVLALLLLFVVPGQKTANAFGEPTVFLQRLRKIRREEGT